MHGTPNQFRLRAPPAVTKERALSRFLASMGPVCAKLRLDAFKLDGVFESPSADWPRNLNKERRGVSGCRTDRFGGLSS